MQLTSILIQEIIRYFAFFRKNKSVYLVFGRQLVISEIAGLVAGVLVAEGISGYFFFHKKIEVSLYSGIADYAASILAFFSVYYYDYKRCHKEHDGENNNSSNNRHCIIRKVLKNTFSIWSSIVVADITYVICRPYLHYLLMIYGLETGIAATIAHFAAFGIFNVVAILSRSVVDYLRN